MHLRSIEKQTAQNDLFIAEISSSLSHPLRIAILKYVRGKNIVRNDVCNNDLVKKFNYSQSTISQHVKRMIDAGLFTIRKVGKFSYYQLNEALLKEYITHINDLAT